MDQASFPEMYERWIVGPLFRPWAELTLDEMKLSPGDRVLDIACGTGIVARVAKERLGTAGHVVGVDISRGMLAVARQVAPDIEWREGNAIDLPLLEKEPFDVIVCDLRMPRLGGREMYEKLAEKHPEVAERVIFATGDTVRGDTLSFLESLGRPFLHKPFTLAELRTVLGGVRRVG